MKAIEYIGAAPKKPKKSSPVGGWFFIVFACVLAGFTIKPFAQFLAAQQDLTSGDNLELTVQELQAQGDFGSKLGAEALRRTQAEVHYDPTYYKIDYPMGDIPANKGVCTDVVVRSYRALGLDLQTLVHEDMKWNFRDYPQIWSLNGPDPNIDHRRVPNLQRFFSRKGQALPISRAALDYQPGDVVAWRLLD
ncbi:MAG: DUF1287 domain-containing protein, partial [Verrucomicrobiales bacterium]